jgi:hypothetical protein
VSWSPEIRLTLLKVFSAIMVPPEEAEKRPVFCMALTVPEAVNTFWTVKVFVPAVWE